MAPLLAIVKLTCKSALRSHVFQALLLLLLVGVVAVPNTVKGDGTAYGYIQVSIDYSVSVISLILSMSAVWLGCSVLSSDVETGQIHMVVVKPVSRIMVWCGKLLGVLLIHAALMAIASSVALLFIELQFGWQKFAPDEKERIKEEVFAGRRAYMPLIPNIDDKVKEDYEARLKSPELIAGKPVSALSAQERIKLVAEIRKRVIANLGEIAPGPENAKYWDYSGLPAAFKGPVCVRYKMYSGSADTKDQKNSYGLWGFRTFVDESRLQTDSAQARKAVQAPKDGPPKMREIYLLRSAEPEQIVCGVYHEFKVPGEMLLHEGGARLGFTDFDPEGKPLFIQQADGPKLLIRETSFYDNYARAIFVSFLRVAILAGIASAAGGLLSMPVAVFMVISYVFIGIFASYLIGMQEAYGLDAPINDKMEAFGFMASKVLMLGVMPLQDFGVSDKLANGELIEARFLVWLVLECLVVKGLPILLLGAFLYRRREFALAMRK